MMHGWRCKMTRAHVAIKWYPAEDIGGREAENLTALTKLQNPNVVRFIDSTNRALLMEHIEGLTLKLHLNRTTMRTLPWEVMSGKHGETSSFVHHAEI